MRTLSSNTLSYLIEGAVEFNLEAHVFPTWSFSHERSEVIAGAAEECLSSLSLLWG